MSFLHWQLACHMFYMPEEPEFEFHRPGHARTHEFDLFE